MKDGITLRVIGRVAAVSLFLLGLAVGASVYQSRLQEKSRLLSENLASVPAAEDHESDDLRELQARSRWLTLAVLLLGGGGVAGGLTAGFLLARRLRRSILQTRTPTNDAAGQEADQLERRLQRFLDFVGPTPPERCSQRGHLPAELVQSPDFVPPPRLERQPVEPANLAGKVNATPGESTTSTIVARDNGPSTATNVAVSDPAAGMTSATWSGNGHTNVSDALGDTVASLAPGTSLTSTMTVQGDPAATGSMVNTTTLADTPPGNTSASEDDTRMPPADLSITKNNGVSGVVRGPSGTYTLTLSNNVPSTVSDFTLTDTLPSLQIDDCRLQIAEEICNLQSAISKSGGSGPSVASGPSVTIMVSGTIGPSWSTTEDVLFVTL